MAVRVRVRDQDRSVVPTPNHGENEELRVRQEKQINGTKIMTLYAQYTKALLALTPEQRAKCYVQSNCWQWPQELADLKPLGLWFPRAPSRNRERLQAIATPADCSKRHCLPHWQHMV